MTVALINQPGHEPLSLTEIKAHLRVNHDHEDQVILDTLRAARQYTEFACDNKLITQEWRQYESCLNVNRQVVLEIRPVKSITAVTVFDKDGAPKVLSQDDVRLVRGSEPATIEFSEKVDFESAFNGVEIDMLVGMGDMGIDIPESLRRAILLLIAHWYEFRGAVSASQQPVSIPAGFEKLIAPYKRMRL